MIVIFLVMNIIQPSRAYAYSQSSLKGSDKQVDNQTAKNQSPRVFSSQTQNNNSVSHNNIVENVAIQDQPPSDCHSTNVIVQNPSNASIGVEAKFCESSTPGSGDLYLINHSQIGHVVKLTSNIGINNLPMVALYTWGPEYWFHVGTVNFPPGSQINISAKRFGDSLNERINSVLFHIDLVADLFFDGKSPSPDAPKSQQAYEAIENFAEIITDIAPDVPEYSEFLTTRDCVDALNKGGTLNILTCLKSVANNDTLRSYINQGLVKFGVNDIPDPLLKAWIDVTWDMLKRIIMLGSYIIGASDLNQDDSIVISYPNGALPIPPCQYCSDSAQFVTDVTLPDGFVASPSQSLIKTWRIKNTGTSTWGSGYKLVFIDGEPMGAPKETDVQTTAPNQQVDLSVPITAPSTSGDHAGYFQLRNPQGTFFGQKIWVKIHVLSNNVASGNIISFDVSPASPSSATTVHIVGRFKAFNDYRSARFVIGNTSFEKPNIKLIGDQYEISTDWQTASLPRGNYAIAFEVANQGDLDWSHPERQVQTYTLNGTPVSTNHPPERPVLSSPYNWYLKDASGNPAPVTLCVNPASDPDGDPVQYWFDVMDQGGGVAYSSGWISNNCWTNTFAANTYSWHAKAGDGSASSDWSSDTWNFSVAKGGVYINGITFYNLNTNDTHACVSVTYDGIQGPNVYAWLNEASDGSDSGAWHLLDHYGPNTTPDCTSSDLHGFWIHSPYYTTGTHLFKVTATKPDSGSSVTRTATYTIAFIQPPPPDTLAPSTVSNNGTWWNTPQINFRWNPSLRADNYTLQVSTQQNVWSDPNPVLHQVLSSSTTSYTATFSQDYNQLFWSVRATDSAGSADSDSRAWFGIDRIAPICQVQSLPATTYENVFQVTWAGNDNASGIQSFDIQYMDSTRGAWSDWELNQPASKTYDLFNGEPGHTYYFRCRSTDQAGNQSHYPDNPNTQIKVDPQSAPQEPWWNNAYSTKRHIIVQNNMAGIAMPSGYPVNLRFDASTTPSAAEIYNNSLSSPKCNDLRILYNNTTEVNRLVTSCTSNLVNIWFRTQAPLPGSGQDPNSYQLYYGNANPTEPLADPNQVWYPYKDNTTTYLYFFQEGSGSTTADSSGNGKTCTIDPSVQWAPSKFGNGLRFNRANLGNSPSLSCGTAIPLTSFTIEFWYKPDTDDSGRIVSELDGVGLNWTLQNFESHLRLDVWPCPTCGSSEVRSNFAFNDPQYVGHWNYVAVTFNGGNQVGFYINGSLDSIKTLNQSGVNTYASPLTIGSGENNGQIKANLGALRISSGVKTSFQEANLVPITIEPTLQVGGILTPPVLGNPDLAVMSVSTFPNPTGGLLVQAVVQNQGTVSTTNGFYTDLYLNHIPTGGGDTSGSIQFWVNDPIPAGGQATLTTVITNVASLGLQALSPGTETHGTLYAQTDSLNSLVESNKTNNISAGVDVCTAIADAYEPDDSTGQAVQLTLGQTQTHNFSTISDQDWLKIQAQAGQTYTIQTSNLGTSADTYLYIYASDGNTLLASNDDADGNTLASRVVWTAPADGTYYVLVKDWNPNVAGCGTGYQVGLYPGVVPLPGQSTIYLPIVKR